MRQRGWLLYALGAGLVLTAQSMPALGSTNVTGRWLREQVSPDGNRTETVIVLERHHKKLSGRVIFAWGEIKIREGEVNGHNFWFKAMTPADTEHPASYDGIVKAGALEVHSHWPGNNNENYTATRASDTTGDPPARIPLPPIRELPPNGLALTPPMGWNSWIISRTTSTRNPFAKSPMPSSPQA